MHRIIKDDLGYNSYIRRIAPKRTHVQKQKRFSFKIWVRKNTRKSLSRKILFSNEKRFDLDGLYNRKNDRMQTLDREILMVDFIEKQCFLKVLWYGSEPVVKVLLVQLLFKQVQ